MIGSKSVDSSECYKFTRKIFSLIGESRLTDEQKKIQSKIKGLLGSRVDHHLEKFNFLLTHPDFKIKTQQEIPELHPEAFVTKNKQEVLEQWAKDGSREGISIKIDNTEYVYQTWQKTDHPTGSDVSCQAFANLIFEKIKKYYLENNHLEPQAEQLALAAMFAMTQDATLSIHTDMATKATYSPESTGFFASIGLTAVVPEFHIVKKVEILPSGFWVKNEQTYEISWNMYEQTDLEKAVRIPLKMDINFKLENQQLARTYQVLDYSFKDFESLLLPLE
jgi:hypothetical protein